MRPLALAVVSALALIVPRVLAQTAPADAAAKDPVAALREWLRDTASAGPTAFEMRWQPRVPALGGLGTPPAVKSATGTFAPDLLQVQGETGQTWLQVGRHCVSREKGGPWRHTKGMPEGTDPPLLLRALAAELTTIAARSIVERDGAPVEQVTLCLTTAQGDQLLSAGAIFETNHAKSAREMVKTGRITAEQVPAATVDVCLDVDVATHCIRRIYVRAMSPTLDLARVMRAPPPNRPPAAPSGAETPAKAEPAPATPPASFKDGLPERDLKGTQVVWIEMLLRDHGKAPAVVLDETQRALLGR
jgi:hypothetical protein